MNYAFLAITVDPHTRKHSQTFSVLTQLQIWRKFQSVTVSFSLDPAVVPKRLITTKVSYFRITKQNVLKVCAGTARWSGQFLTVVGFKAQLLGMYFGSAGDDKNCTFW